LNPFVITATIVGLLTLAVAFNLETILGLYYDLRAILSQAAEIMGMSGWQGAGWTSPGLGTHHYPEVHGGALVALFFLPAGRISYKARPGAPQPIAI
jgi:hypothetical protein